MGIYLNSRSAYTLFKSEKEKPYFIDKSKMLEDLFPLVRTGNNHICIIRPRRFGKTVMANMIASFFSKACDAQDVFQSLQIARTEGYGMTGIIRKQENYCRKGWDKRQNRKRKLDEIPLPMRQR